MYYMHSAVTSSGLFFGRTIELFNLTDGVYVAIVYHLNGDDVHTTLSFQEYDDITYDMRHSVGYSDCVTEWGNGQ